MRILGDKISLRQHEQDVLFSGAACKANPRGEIKAVGESFMEQHKVIKGVRASLEDAEDNLVVAEALVQATDTVRDKTLVQAGAFTDSLGEGDRAKLFRIPPSAIGQLAYQKETDEIESVLTKIRQYADDHPLRLAYETRIAKENEEFRAAVAGKSEADQQLVAARFTVTKAKLDNDTLRQAQYGELVKLVGKKEAEGFFRTWTKRKKEELPETVEDLLKLAEELE